MITRSKRIPANTTMNFTKTLAEDFTIIKNGVDDRLEIIRHDETGYYNITKIAKLVHDLKIAEKRPAGISAGPNKMPSKRPNAWFEIQSTQLLISEVQTLSNIINPKYELDVGTNNDFKGTYVHPDLYDHFLMWLDPRYALRVSYILKNVHKEANRKILKEKDDKIDELHAKMDKLLGFAEDTKDELQEVKSELKETNVKLDELHVKFDESFDFATELGRMALHMWVGPNVFKTQLDHLINGHTLHYALQHLKVMFIVCFHSSNEGSTQMILYFCCTNFADVGPRISQLYRRHLDMQMFKPEAICLISHEINNERAKLQQIAFANDEVTYNAKRKSFELHLSSTDVNQVVDKFNVIVTNVRSENFQGYQMRREEASSNESVNLDPSILAHITKTDKQFFNDTLPLCQSYIDCYVEQVDETQWYKYTKSSQRRMLRHDLGLELRDLDYPLYKLNGILEERGSASTFDHMIESGIISKSNTKGLLRTSKIIADNEQLELNAEMRQKLDEIVPHLISDDEDETDDESTQ